LAVGLFPGGGRIGGRAPEARGHRLRTAGDQRQAPGSRKPGRAGQYFPHRLARRSSCRLTQPQPTARCVPRARNGPAPILQGLPKTPACRMSERFELVSPYAPAGDQPYAIEKLVEGFEAGLARQVLLGVTGSGKTYTVANVVQQVQKPTLVMAHNKTLAAQLYGEFKAFFPNNAVEYFVSYYDYYQPEAYVPSSDTSIETDSSINEHIEQMRLAATTALLSRRDVPVVATVSAIYGLGAPE